MWSEIFSDDQVDSNQTEHGRLAHTALTVIVTLHRTHHHADMHKSIDDWIEQDTCMCVCVCGGLAQLVATLVESTKLLYAGPG